MVGRRWFRVTLGAFGIALGVGLAAWVAPVAAADSTAPTDTATQATSELVSAAPTSDQAGAVPAAAPAADAAPSVTPADGAQHLPSPDSLPPGTTQQAPEHSKLNFLRDIWHAVKSGDVKPTDALLLLGTRPVNPDQLAGSKPSNQTGPTPEAAVEPVAPVGD